MLKRKIIRLLFSYMMLWFLLVKLLGIDLASLIPPGVRELGKGLVIVIFIYVAFRLYDYFAATPERRRTINSNLLRWFLPGSRYNVQDHGAAENPSLLVKESRWMMVVDAAEATVPLVVLALAYLAIGDYVEVRYGILAIAGLFILSSLVTLLQAIIADDLVHITDEGIALPCSYSQVIPWADVTAVEQRRVKNKGYELTVYFTNPAPSYAWRGVFGGFRGHNAYKKGKARIRVSLEHANAHPGDVRAAIDYYLVDHGRCVVLNEWDSEPMPTMKDFLR